MPSGERSVVSTAAEPTVDVQTEACQPLTHFALVEFERPVICPTNSLIIASRLDADAYILFNTKYSILQYKNTQYCSIPYSTTFLMHIILRSSWISVGL